MISTGDVIAISFLALGALLSKTSGKLTTPGAIAGLILGLLLYLGTGWAGVTVMAAFFILGTVVTRWKRKEKEGAGIAESNSGRRNHWQVLANAGAGAVAGLTAFFLPSFAEPSLLVAASAFAAAASDTFSSELGQVYGKRFFNILTREPDLRGRDGVISFEGIMAGLAGSLCIAVVYTCFAGWNTNLLIIILAGMFGNLADSVLGAALERNGKLGNDMVNFLATASAALFALLLIFFGV